jgi:hypothetical protein
MQLIKSINEINDINKINILIDLLQNNKPCTSLELQKSALLILGICPGFYLNELKRFMVHFENILTPHYKQLLPEINFQIKKRDELIFHPCKPDIYLWNPPKSLDKKKVLIIFLTRNNALNMPWPLAHFALAKFNTAIMYVTHRNKAVEHHYVGNENISSSATIIKDIAKELGFTDLRALGASFGGYKACSISNLVGFKRVLNFSGIDELNDIKNEKAFMAVPSHFARDNILTILSKKNELDKKIELQYEKDGFLSKINYVDLDTHATFSAAIIERRLEGFMKWLLDV